MADDEVMFRLPGMERLELREQERSVEPRDRGAHTVGPAGGLRTAGANVNKDPAPPEGASGATAGVDPHDKGERGPAMRSPADWQAAKDYVGAEKRTTGTSAADRGGREHRTWEEASATDGGAPMGAREEAQTGERGAPKTTPGRKRRLAAKLEVGDGPRIGGVRQARGLPALELPTGEGDGAWNGSGAKPVVKPTRYDGSTDLGDYLNHFDLCVKVNGWDAQQAGMFLGLSLAGPARRLLTGRTPATVAGYAELRQALVERFEPTNQEETYKAFLRTRIRKPEEGLQALQEDLMKYTRLAYPEADARTTDTLVLDRFLLCLDPQLRQWVYQTQPRDLQQAVMTAVGAEAYLNTDRGQQPRMRAADATVNEHLTSNTDRLDKLATMVERLLTNRVESANKEKKKVTTTACFGCGQEGHFKRECPQRKPSTGERKPAAEGVAVEPQQASGN